jgi:hypothetical protein
LWKAEVSDGFTTLLELKQLDLSVEAFVFRPEYAPFFTEEREIARARLLGGSTDTSFDPAAVSRRQRACRVQTPKPFAGATGRG